MASDSFEIQGLPQDENPQDITLPQLLVGFGIFPVAASKAMAKPSLSQHQDKAGKKVLC